MNAFLRKKAIKQSSKGVCEFLWTFCYAHLYFVDDSNGGIPSTTCIYDYLFANASLFGWWQGALLSWGSAMIGAAVAFYLARLFGRGFVEKLTTKTGLSQVDEFFDSYGKQSILIVRLLPFLSFGVVT